MIAGVKFGKNNVTGHMEETETRTVVPAETHVIDESTAEYILNFEETDSDVSLALEFYTSHYEVQVYAGEELIYSVFGEKSLFGRSTGSRINLVELPVHTKTVRIVLHAVYGTIKSAPDFKYGDAIVLFYDMIKSSAMDTAMSLIIFVFGVCLIIYWFVVHKKVGQNPAIIYFGIFSAIVGLWTSNETDMVRLMYPNRMIGSMIAYMLLSVLIVPVVQFERYFFEKEKSPLANLICFVATMETVVLTCLHMSGIREYKQTVWMNHGMMFVALGYMGFVIWERIRKCGMDRKVRVNIIAVFVLLFASLTDMAAYYTDLEHTDMFGKLGFLIYVFILGRETVADTIQKVKEGEKAQSYLKLAITDVMTGLMNRSAFEEWEETCTDLTDIMIVTFDLNNLKYCNDNLGHAAGDEYIIESANMIQRVFGTVGQCYRIGGDEFCAVIRKASHLDIEKYLERLREEQNSYNEQSDSLKIHIAVGYAIHEESEADMEETRSRADVLMYRNKKQLKENGER
jgi:diguanylate cyclase (GGDEF)-like protein